MVNDNSMRWGGRLAARWAQQAVERLRRQRGSIDSINVFPVADGDTGSNMYATVKSAYRAVEAIDGPATLPRVVEAMAAGALRGARGNSVSSWPLPCGESLTNSARRLSPKAI